MAALDPFQIEGLAAGLNSRLSGSTFRFSFSTDKEQLYLVFDQQCLHVHFFRGQAYMEIQGVDNLPKRNRQQRFRPLEGLELSAVESIPFDRVMRFRFGDLELVIRMFGRFSQMDLYESDAHIEAFPLSRKSYASPPGQRQVGDPDGLESLFGTHPWLEPSEAELLHASNAQGMNKVLRQFERICADRRARNWKAVQSNIGWVLQQSEVPTDLLEELGLICRRHIPSVLFHERKDQLIRDKEKELSILRAKRLRMERSLLGATSNRTDREKADLLMAHLHAVGAGDKEIILNSFETGEPVRIKLDPRLSAQENAQRYYERSKDERKKREYLKRSLEELKQEEVRLQAELEAIVHLESSREVKEQAQKIQKDGPVLPYRTIKLGEFELRIGKSARDNDELLRSYSSAHDLWFHAHAVSGSHVVLRLSKGQKPSEALLEQAASVAAHYSKARSEALVRVIYTYRKFVRKPKGANPGAVLVEHEKSLLVEPVLPQD